MKRIILFALAGLVVLSFMTDSGFAWGPATHIYITRRLDRRLGAMNFQKIYGGIAPDIFSYIYRVPSRKYLETQMHTEVMGLLAAADKKELKAFALGFMGHNEVWGADYIARHEPDYIGRKSDQLIARIQQNPTQFSEELRNTMDALFEIEGEYMHGLCCIAVEYSVDLLIKRNEDPEIGARIILATTLRDPNIPSLLTSVYGRNQEEIQTILSSEMEFRKAMLAYGNNLLLDERSAVKAVAGMIAEIAPDAICIDLPNQDKLTSMGIELLNAALVICRSDYSQYVSIAIETVKRKINTGYLNTDLDPVEEEVSPWEDIISPPQTGIYPFVR
ncbi:MAG: hypothetical protein AB1847_15660 [bacterium]